MTPVFPSTMDVTARVMSIALRHRKSLTARDVDPKPSWSGGDERLGLGVKMGAPAKRWDVNVLCKKFVRKAVLITSRRYGGKMGSIASDPKNQQRICANGEPADHCPGVPFIGQRHCASRSSRGRQGQQGFVSTSRMWWRTQIMLRRRASRCVYIFILYTLINMSYDMSACILFSLSLFHALDLAPKL